MSFLKTHFYVFYSDCTRRYLLYVEAVAVISAKCACPANSGSEKRKT